MVATSRAPVKEPAPARAHARIGELDGLRGIAIWLVLVWHLFVVPATTSPTASDAAARAWWLKVAARLFSLSWAGVDLFFVLSGFLITGILLDTRARRNYFTRFYVRRAFRILPVYYAVLASCTLAPLLLMGESQAPGWMSLLFLQNVWFAANSTLGAPVLGVTWSLAVEEQFYLVLPVVVRQTSRRTLAWAFFAATMLAPIARIALTHAVGSTLPAFVLAPCRGDALALGGWVALLARGPHREVLRKLVKPTLVLSFVSMAIMIGTGQSAASHYADAIGYTTIALGAAALLVLALDADGAFARVLRFGPLRALGRISYGVYLFHMIALVLGRLYLGVPEHLHNLREAVPAVGLPLALTLGLALVSYHLVEKRLIAYGQRHTA